jgi:hypothetical protein
MTIDTDQELINQLTNLKKEMEERMCELELRGHQVEMIVGSRPPPLTFNLRITKTVETEVLL